jgi:hypothetical protein
VFPAFSNLGVSNFLLVNLKLQSAQHQQSYKNSDDFGQKKKLVALMFGVTYRYVK